MSIRPQKLLLTTLTILDYVGYWEEDNGDGFYGYPNKWRVSLGVTFSPHSSVTTREPFYYTGQDIAVGDWISGFAENGAAVVITEIISADDYTVECIVEDYERYNTLSDPTMSGTGLVDTVTGFVFEIGPTGQPLISSLPSYYGPLNVAEGIKARFDTRNLYTNTVQVYQTNHGLAQGDIIVPDYDEPGRFIQAKADDNVNKAIGIVTGINTPGINYFTFMPLGKLINNIDPGLVGEFGDIFYMDPANPGKLTTTKPLNNARAIYMRLDLPNRGILLNQSSDDSNETRKYDVEEIELDQVEFTLPADTETVLYMSINGIENTNYTFDVETKALTFDPEATGYGVDPSDEVFFIYKS